VSVSSVPDGSITSNKLAAGSVGTAALAPGAVGSAQLASNAVMSANIAAGAVGSTQLASNLTVSGTLTANSFTGTFTGNGAGLTNLNTTNLTGKVPAAQLSGTVANSQLANSGVTVNAGSGLSGGGTVALGGSTTLSNAGLLSVTGNADITASTLNGVVTLGDTATTADTPSTLVKRDASGNFSAGTITASLAGNATSASMATTATYVLGEGLMLTNVVAQASHATNADYASVAGGVAAGATLNPADAWALTNINSANVVTTTNSTPIGVTVDFSIRESTTSPAGSIAFTAISNWNPTNYNWSIVHVLAQGADCTVTFGPGWRTSGGPCIVTNGTMKDFLFTCQINVFTNAQWISAY
jgi:hypothetical protein